MPDLEAPRFADDEPIGGAAQNERDPVDRDQDVVELVHSLGKNARAKAPGKPSRRDLPSGDLLICAPKARGPGQRASRDRSGPAGRSRCRNGRAGSCRCPRRRSCRGRTFPGFGLSLQPTSRSATKSAVAARKNPVAEETMAFITGEFVRPTAPEISSPSRRDKREFFRQD